MNPHMPTNQRHTDTHLSLVITHLCSKFWVIVLYWSYVKWFSQERADRHIQTDGQMDATNRIVSLCYNVMQSMMKKKCDKIGKPNPLTTWSFERAYKYKPTNTWTDTMKSILSLLRGQ